MTRSSRPVFGAVALLLVLLPALAGVAAAQGVLSVDTGFYPATLSGQTRFGGEQAADDPFTLYEAGKLDEARRAIGAQLATSRRVEDRLREAIALDFEGLIFQRQGDPWRAIDNHRLAARILESLGSTAVLARLNALNNLGLALYLSARHVEARDALTDVLDVPGGGLAHRLSQARARNNRGIVNQDLGEDGLARLDFGIALALARGATTDESLIIRAQALSNLGLVAARGGDVAEAQLHLLEARSLAWSVGNEALEAQILGLLSDALLGADGDEATRRAFAVEALQRLADARALDVGAAGLLLRPAMARDRGRALQRLRRMDEAGAELEDAVRLAEPLRVPALLRDVLGARGEYRLDAGRLDDAIADVQRAIDIAERHSRERLTDWRSLQRLYDAMVRALTAKGDLEKALVFVEKSKTTALRHELGVKDADARKALEEYQARLRREAALTEQLRQLLATGQEEAAEGLRATLEATVTENAAAWAQIQLRYSKDLVQAAAVDSAELKRLGASLEPGHLLVSYLVGEETLHIFLVSSRGFEWREVAIRRLHLEQLVREYARRVLPSGGLKGVVIDSWASPQWQPLREATTALYEVLLEPIEAQWKAATRLIIAPTGLLMRVPFHALGRYDEQAQSLRYVIDETVVSYFTAASAEHMLAPAPPARNVTLLAFADPVPDARSRPRLGPAVYAAEEARALGAMGGSRVTVLVGPEATRARLLAGASQVGILHFGTLCFTDPTSPADAWLALDGSQRLTAREVATLDLRSVHLATLTSCDVAVDATPGRDMMSFATSFAKAGVASIVFTLWSPSDKETRDLMVAFYATLLNQGSPMDKAAALRNAQLGLLHRQETQHPFFWAGFILVGDWR